MPRIEYSCICDACSKNIVMKNEENDISYNGFKLVFCDICYQESFSLLEVFGVVRGTTVN